VGDAGSTVRERTASGSSKFGEDPAHLRSQQWRRVGAPLHAQVLRRYHVSPRPRAAGHKRARLFLLRGFTQSVATSTAAFTQDPSVTLQSAVHGACDLLARSSPDRGTERQSPAVWCRCRTPQPQTREHRGLIYVGGDLLSSALRGDVLGLRQPGSPGGSGKGEEIVGDHRHGASCALLPGRISSRIDDHLADDAPAGVMRIATRDKKPRERVGNPLGVWLGCVAIEMPQRSRDLMTTIHSPCQVPSG
jgi:hypothetical protein